MQAATLRNRHSKLQASQAKAASHPTHPDDPVRPPPRRAPHIMTARLRLIGTAAVILLVFTLLKTRNSTNLKEKAFLNPDDGEWVKVGKMPEMYALCSRDGRSGPIWTVGGGQAGEETRECMVVKGKEVLETGTLAEIRTKYGDSDTLGPPRAPPNEKQVPIEVVKSGLKIYWIPEGGAVTPGLIDSHGHILEYGHWKSSVDLFGASSVEDVVQRLKTFVMKQGCSNGKRWIEGMGWDQNTWEVKEFPTAADLEAEPTLAHLPITLTRVDGHALWVSPAILRLMDPLPSTIPGGEIVRDPLTDEPTGIFIDNAMKLVEAVRPSRTEEEQMEYLKKMMREGLKRGLTGVHDAGVPKEDVEFFRKVASTHSLPLRIYAMLACPDRSLFCGGTPSSPYPKIPWSEYDGRLVLRSVKLVADGALGSWGAAMIDPYTDRQQDGWRGIMLAPEERFRPLIREWTEAGWQVNVHAIGDRAGRAVLDGFEGVQDEARRPRLEHAQILTPEDLQRMVNLGVIASFQPTHATSDMSYAETKIGPDRIRTAYAWQSVLQKGGRIALGSDFPIESADPLLGFYSAITRCSPATHTSPHGPGGWHPLEKLTRHQALKGMTLDAAYASFSENITGSLEKGQRADYVVWDRDIMSVDAEGVLEAKVVMTVVDGQAVWGSL